MEQKRVSFKVARVIKEAGYPIEIKSIEEAEALLWRGKAFFTGMCSCGLCPYYLDVWLWLWREKKFFIKIHVINKEFNFQILEYQEDGWKSYGIVSSQSYHDQEEAIIAAIEYLVENNLL